MKNTIRKTAGAFLLLLLYAGVYGGTISLCNRYLREHHILNNISQFILAVVLYVGFYAIYRKFIKRLKSIDNEQ